MADTAAGGWVRWATRSSVSTRPSASLSATFSAGSGRASASTRCSASATGINGMILRLRAVVAGLAAALFEQTNALDMYAALHRLDHVVDRQTSNRGRDQRFHLDASLSGDLHCRLHQKTGQRMLRIDVDLDLGNRQRMAEPDQPVGAFGRH